MHPCMCARAPGCECAPVGVRVCVCVRVSVCMCMPVTPHVHVCFSRGAQESVPVLLSLVRALYSTYRKRDPERQKVTLCRGQIYSRDKEKTGRQWKEAVMLNELS